MKETFIENIIYKFLNVCETVPWNTTKWEQFEINKNCVSLLFTLMYSGLFLGIAGVGYCGCCCYQAFFKKRNNNGNDNNNINVNTNDNDKVSQPLLQNEV
ncbi:MAG: hypothetical protein PVI75_00135 [Gammaproteobacteria bacterium]|jgi:hypothetical protein